MKILFKAWCEAELSEKIGAPIFVFLFLSLFYLPLFYQPEQDVKIFTSNPDIQILAEVKNGD